MKTKEDANYDVIIRRGDIIIESPKPEVIPVTVIGKGLFKKVFKAQNSDRVFILNNGGISGYEDYSCEILSRCKKTIFLPQLRQVGHTNTGTVYETVLYKKFKKANVKNRHWQLYTLLRDINRDFKYIETYEAYLNMRKTIQKIKKDARSTRTFVDTIMDIEYNTANYNCTWDFEFSPRNLGVDKNGNLVLIDPIYDLELVRKYRMSKYLNC